MPFFNPNAYYNPFTNQGIFGIGSAPGRAGFFDLSGYSPYMPSTPPAMRTPVAPNPAANVGQSAGIIDSRLAAGGPTFNTATQLNNAAAGGTGGGAGGAGSGAGGAAQGYGILPWLGVGLYGANTLGNLVLGWRSLNLAQDQFDYQRELANQNLANSIQAYNNALRSRIRGRSGAFSEEDIDRMMEDQKLRDTRKRR